MFHVHVSQDDVRVELYRWFIEEGRAPSPCELSISLSLPLSDVRDALEGLNRDDVIVLDEASREIWLAHPFSARKEPFQVRSANGKWDAICIWDALGILAMTASDGEVTTACPDCAEPVVVRVKDGEIGLDGVIHFGVPARRWYEDIGYT